MAKAASGANVGSTLSATESVLPPLVGGWGGQGIARDYISSMQKKSNLNKHFSFFYFPTPMMMKLIFRNPRYDSHIDETLSDWHLICIHKNVSNFKTAGNFTRFCPFWKSYFLYFGTRVANRTSIKLHHPSQDLIAGSQHRRQFTTPNIHWLQQLRVTDVLICLQTVSVEMAEVKLRQSLIKIQDSSDRDQIRFCFRFCENQLLSSHHSVYMLFRIADPKVLFIASHNEKDKVEQNT